MKNIIIWASVFIVLVVAVMFFAKSAARDLTSIDTTGKVYLFQSVANPNLGNHLAASNGMTLYTYANDTMGLSTCVDQCAINWPPYIISPSSALFVPAEVVGGISVLNRADGSTQATYRGLPLYFWKGDTKPGDTKGQNVGEVWFVAKP